MHGRAFSHAAVFRVLHHRQIQAAAAARVWRMILSSRMGRPSSLKATAPARLSAAKSVSCSPRLPMVAAATGKTVHVPRRALDRRIQRVISAESFTGLVFGMVQTEVNPPAAAAMVPLAMVSLCDCPGSRR